jgi:hypothetical protein
LPSLISQIDYNLETLLFSKEDQFENRLILKSSHWINHQNFVKNSEMRTKNILIKYNILTFLVYWKDEYTEKVLILDLTFRLIKFS